MAFFTYEELKDDDVLTWPEGMAPRFLSRLSHREKPAPASVNGAPQQLFRHSLLHFLSMKTPSFDIDIAPSNADSRIRVNGVDITGDVRGLRIELVPGELSKVTLHLAAGHARARINQAIENVEIVDDAAPSE